VVSLQISPQLWSLLPQVVACYDEFAIDYMEQMEVPLQNYICRGTEVLLTSQEPNYLGLVSSWTVSNRFMQTFLGVSEKWCSAVSCFMFYPLFHVLRRVCNQAHGANGGPAAEPHLAGDRAPAHQPGTQLPGLAEFHMLFQFVLCRVFPPTNWWVCVMFAYWHEFLVDFVEVLRQNYICLRAVVLLTSQEPNYLGLVSSANTFLHFM
jgi:hypothetical protein